MSKDFIYISDGRMFLHSGTGDREIPSAVLESYKRKLADSAKRNEWKTSGSGAAFIGAAVPGVDAETRIASVYSAISSAAMSGDSLIYSVDVCGQTGIYKTDTEGGDGGIVLSSGSESYSDFDLLDGRLAYSAAFAGQSHIGTKTVDSPSNDATIFTDGDSWDFQPVFSRVEKNKIYFCSSGLLLNADTGKQERPASYPEMFRMMMSSEASSVRGPSSICLLDPVAGTLDTVLENPSFDYLHPQSTRDGSLWYIRRPYSEEKTTNPLGCLTDIIMLPVRLIQSLFGFLSVFSMTYSGKPLDNSSSAASKKADEKKLFIDGNFIDAEKAMKENAAKGEEDPGIIPRSWELHRMAPDGSDTVVRRGVTAYRVLDDGTVLLSNGSAIIEGTPDGGKLAERKVCSAKRVTFIN